MIIENGIAKPYPNRFAGFAGHSKEEGEYSWEQVWKFLPHIDMVKEFETYKNMKSSSYVDLYSFTKYLESHYPYKQGLFNSLFDGISLDEFQDYLEYMYPNKFFFSEEIVVSMRSK